MSKVYGTREKKVRAFTLVELIVVITILAILGTIGFVSMQGFAAKSRDSARISDLKSIVRVLELHHLENNTFPATGSGFQVTYSGSSLWTQGYFDDSVRQKTQRISTVPLDPLTKNQYLYSVSYNGQEYQIAGALEGGDVLSVMPQALADFSNLYILGNYNGALLGKKIDERVHIFGVPSLITNSINSVSILDIMRDSLFVVNKYAAIPDNLLVSGTPLRPKLGFTSTTPEDIIVFSGSLSELQSQEGLNLLADNIYSLYDESVLENYGPIQNYITNNPQDLGSPDLIANDITEKIQGLRSIENLLEETESIADIVDTEEVLTCAANFVTTIENVSGDNNLARIAQGVTQRDFNITDSAGNTVSACNITMRSGGSSTTIGTSACGNIDWGTSFTHMKALYRSDCPLNGEGNCHYKFVDSTSGDDIYEILYTSTGDFIEANVLEDTLPDYLQNEYTCTGVPGLYVTGSGPITVSNWSSSTASVNVSYTDGNGVQIRIGGSTSTTNGPTSYSTTRNIPSFASMILTRTNTSLPQTYNLSSTSFPDFEFNETVPLP